MWLAPSAGAFLQQVCRKNGEKRSLMQHVELVYLDNAPRVKYNPVWF